MQDLVDAILHLGHLPSQASSSSAEEKRLATRLIRARKAGALTWQQEANLRALQPDTGVEQEDSDAGASASRQQAAAGGASESVAADPPGEKAECKALAKQKAEQKADLKRRQKTAEIMEQVRKLGRYPKESAGRSVDERQLAEKTRRARKAKEFSLEDEAELQALQQAADAPEEKAECKPLAKQKVEQKAQGASGRAGRKRQQAMLKEGAAAAFRFLDLE